MNYPIQILVTIFATMAVSGTIFGAVNEYDDGGFVLQQFIGYFGLFCLGMMGLGHLLLG